MPTATGLAPILKKSAEKEAANVASKATAQASENGRGGGAALGLVEGGNDDGAPMDTGVTVKKEMIHDVDMF